jgi:hypothetical protein
LANSENLCAKTKRAAVRMVGQNGAHLNRQPALQVGCGAPRHKRHPQRAKEVG